MMCNNFVENSRRGFALVTQSIDSRPYTHKGGLVNFVEL